MKECRCNKCTCTAVVERPDYMSVCDKCHEDCYYFGLGNIRADSTESYQLWNIKTYTFVTIVDIKLYQSLTVQNLLA